MKPAIIVLAGVTLMIAVLATVFEGRLGDLEARVESLERQLTLLESSNREQHGLIWDNMEGLGRQQVQVREMVEQPEVDVPLPVISARYVSREVEVADTKTFWGRVKEVPADFNGDVIQPAWNGVAGLWR